jgi:type II secretion system (T2SS) protein E
VSLNEDTLALAFRTGLPFVGLRDHAHDPDLDRLIPPDAARTARAIPLTADDDRIRLAVADPDTDLSPLDRYLAGRQVDLALAPREEIDTILGPPPPPGEDPAEAATEEPVAVEAEEPEALAEAAPESGPVTAAEPERLAAEPEPDPLIAEPEPELERVAEREPLVGDEAAPLKVPAPEGVAAESAPEPVAPEPEPGLVAAAAQPEAAALSDVDAELAGEVPSWLEPRPRRWWRVVLAVLLVIVVLALAAVLVVAIVNA